MELTHSFTVPVPAGEAWVVLRDIERIAPCMPGAALESVDGDEFTGSVKVKVGPMQVTYRGTARFASVDEDARAATIEANAKETRGTGTARATIAAALTEAGDSTDVTVTTDLTITGKPAQFGRGVMVDVGNKLLDRFASCLAEELGATGRTGEDAGDEPPHPAGVTPRPDAPGPPPAAAPPGEPTPAGPPPAAAPPAARRDDDAIDLLEVAGGAVAKRLAPVAAAVAFLLLVLRARRRRRARRTE